MGNENRKKLRGRRYSGTILQSYPRLVVNEIEGMLYGRSNRDPLRSVRDLTAAPMGNDERDISARPQ